MTEESCHLRSNGKGKTGGRRKRGWRGKGCFSSPTSPGPEAGASLSILGLPPLCENRGRRSLAPGPVGTGSLEPGPCPRSQHQEVALVTPSSGHLGQPLPETGPPRLGRRAGESARGPAHQSQHCTSRAATFGTPTRSPSLFYKVLRRPGSQGGTERTLTPRAQKQGVGGPPHVEARLPGARVPSSAGAAAGSA